MNGGEIGVFVSGVAVYSLNGPSYDLYSTLVTVGTNDTGYTVDRTVPQMYYVGASLKLVAATS